MASEIKGISSSNYENLRDQFGAAVVESMQEMVHLSIIAKQNGELDKGIWYPGDYIEALKAKGNASSIQRYEWLRNKGHLVDGWLKKIFFQPVFQKMNFVSSTIVKRRTWNFLANEDVLPSAAVKAAKLGLSILDCGTVCQIARYDALLKILGEEKFNRLFSDQYGQRLNISFDDDALNPLRYFFDFTAAAKKGENGSVNERNVKVGQMISFNGVSKYLQKFPGGMGGNYNVICLDATPGKQLYIGHGLSANGATEKKIATQLIREYNKIPDHFSRVPETRKDMMQCILQIQNSADLEKDQISVKKPLKTVMGFDSGSPQDVCVELIADLVKLPLEQLSMEYVKTHQYANRNFPDLQNDKNRTGFFKLS